MKGDGNGGSIPKVEHVLKSDNLLGEGPVWDDARDVLCWVDIDRRLLLEFSPATGAQTSIEMEVAVCALGLVAGSTDLVIATAKGFAIWRRRLDVIDWIRDPEPGRPGARLNDGAVDPQGNFWAGSLGPGFESALYRLSQDHSLTRMESGLGVSNGMAWSPDSSKMYLTDSRRRTIYEYHYHPGTSTISSRKALITTGENEGVPDGLAVDAEGFLWSVTWGSGNIKRYRPDGSIERTIPLPVAHATSCAFGGPNLDHLYITSARCGTDPPDRPAGDLFRIRPGVRGTPEPRFREP